MRATRATPQYTSNHADLAKTIQALVEVPSHSAALLCTISSQSGLSLSFRCPPAPPECRCVECSCDMLFISIRTDVSWYRLSMPHVKYAPWFRTVVRGAQLGVKVGLAVWNVCLPIDPYCSVCAAHGCVHATPVAAACFAQQSRVDKASLPFALLHTLITRAHTFPLHPGSLVVTCLAPPCCCCACPDLQVAQMLQAESRASKLSFNDVVKRVAELPTDNSTFISKRTESVERFLVVRLRQRANSAYGLAGLQLHGFTRLSPAQ